MACTSDQIQLAYISINEETYRIECLAMNQSILSEYANNVYSDVEICSHHMHVHMAQRRINRIYP